jgi:hypothetical protein
MTIGGPAGESIFNCWAHNDVFFKCGERPSWHPRSLYKALSESFRISRGSISSQDGTMGDTCRRIDDAENNRYTC